MYGVGTDLPAMEDSDTNNIRTANIRKMRRDSNSIAKSKEIFLKLVSL
jgi:hypothetical protein